MMAIEDSAIGMTEEDRAIRVAVTEMIPVVVASVTIHVVDVTETILAVVVIVMNRVVAIETEITEEHHKQELVSDLIFRRTLLIIKSLKFRSIKLKLLVLWFKFVEIMFARFKLFLYICECLLSIEIIFPRSEIHVVQIT
ncbi:hypothetical protein RF11_08800 [Thelohanellus kitauei]|uniref:Uncharacterized protein n=1 Tax=Thelohanellus kitauei TaxID=669202 RepID=A0A0C2MHW7_THEKT|nr:hypothetical protein RF11_08800 [Thelohanellus kitauei]